MKENRRSIFRVREAVLRQDMKKLITGLISVALLLLSASCGPEPVEVEGETPAPQEETWQIEIDWFLYGRQAIWGDIAVGVEYVPQDDGPPEYYLATYNLRTREKGLPQRLREAPSGGPAIHEDRVVWASDGDIFLLDMETGEQQQLTNDKHTQRSPVIFGDTVVWLDDRHNSGTSRPYPPALDVYAYSLSTGEERRITANTTAEGYGLPAISGDFIAWTDSRHADPGVMTHASNEPDYNNEIYIYDLAAGEERRITTFTGNDRNPAISGNHIVWLRQSGYAEADVYSYDLKAGQEGKVSSSGYAAGIPGISGKRIVWTDAKISKGNTSSDVIANGQPGAADIRIYDLGTGTEKILASGAPGAAADGWRVLDNPVIHGDLAIFTHSRQIGPIAYAARLDS